MDSDFREKVTKNIIKQSYLELLQESEKITVTKICRKAGISRTTFYNHYGYLDDIMDEIGREYSDNLRDVIITNDLDARRILRTVLTEIKNTGSFQLELAADSSNLIDRKINIMADRLLRERFGRIFGTDDEILLKMIPAYLSSGINAVIRCWIDTGFKNSVEEVENLLMSLLPAVTGRHE